MPSPTADGIAAAIKHAVSIVDLVGEHVALTRRGRTFKGLCPFHDDHNPSLNVDPERQIYKCFSCGASGDVFSFVMSRERVGFREALEVLAQRARIALPRRVGRGEAGQSKDRLLEVLGWAEQQYRHMFWESQAAEPARKYAESRGLSAESLRNFGIGFAPKEWEWLVQSARARRITPEDLERCGLATARQRGSGHVDFFRGRLMFPIRDARGRTIAFGGRILPEFAGERDAKYTNSRESPFFTKSEHLYGLDRARDAIIKANVAVVVEGYTDCIMAHQHGLTHVVGTLGTALGSEHIRTLKRYSSRIVLVYDGDKAGNDASDRALSLFLSNEVDVRIQSLADQLDPCDFLIQRGAQEFRRGLDSAVDALDFKLRRAGQLHDVTQVHGRRQALDFVLQAIAAVPVVSTGSAAVTREIVLDRLGQRLGLPAEMVRRRLREVREQQLRGRKDRGEDSSSESKSAWANETVAERELMESLLAEPGQIAAALSEFSLDDIKTPGFRRILEVCVAVIGEGGAIELDDLRLRLEDRELACRASILAETGREKGAVERRLADVLAFFRNQRVRNELQGQAERGDLPDSDEAKKQFLALKYLSKQSRQRMAQRHALSDS